VTLAFARKGLRVKLQSAATATGILLALLGIIPRVGHWWRWDLEWKATAVGLFVVAGVASACVALVAMRSPTRALLSAISAMVAIYAAMQITSAALLTV
jgi:hypothetical protein